MRVAMNKVYPSRNFASKDAVARLLQVYKNYNYGPLWQWLPLRFGPQTTSHNRYNFIHLYLFCPFRTIPSRSHKGCGSGLLIRCSPDSGP